MNENHESGSTSRDYLDVEKYGRIGVKFRSNSSILVLYNGYIRGS